ncbi:MAG: mechanosensitive ion channel family protein [Gammaproteobacteria bacterium]|nr:mechanosensitive ion channel family protein [Gammaproteobacteria bacterium]
MRWVWLGSHVFLIVLATACVRLIATGLLNKFVQKKTETRSRWKDALSRAASKPLDWGIWVVGLSFAGNRIYDDVLTKQTLAALAETDLIINETIRDLLAHEGADSIFERVGTLRSVALVVLVAWFTNRFIKEFQEVVALPRRDGTESRWDPATASAVGRVLRASVIITTGLLILQVYGLPIEGVLAFGGIGGIAVGFAAKDVLANFFGTLMLLVDKPFVVGDWIRSPDREIEGTVEDVGWRTTRIRTFDRRPLYVPNANFASLTVENPQRMENRRIYETFRLRYEDMPRVKELMDEVREMLRNHPAIDVTRTLMVNLDTYTEFSVNFFVYTFTKTTEWTEFHEIKEEILLLISDIVHKHGADFAFPTQTLYLENDLSPQST